MEASHTKLKSCQSFHGPSRAPPECRPYLQSHFELRAIVVSPSSNDHPYTCPLCMRPQILKAGTANTAIPIIHHLRRPLPMCSFCGTIICNHILSFVRSSSTSLPPPRMTIPTHGLCVFDSQHTRHLASFHSLPNFFHNGHRQIYFLHGIRGI